MRITETITPSVLQAATAMLSPYVPEISSAGLVAALKAYGGPDSPAAAPAAPAPTATPRFAKPLTRREVAALFGCSLQSVSRWLSAGTLRKIKIGKRAVRIDPASVAALLERGIEEAE